MFGIDVVRLTKKKKNGGYQEVQPKHICGVNEPLKTQIGPVHTSLFSSPFLLLFLCPRLSHTRADTDQSPQLYLLCVLWQNRGK